MRLDCTLTAEELSNKQRQIVKHLNDNSSGDAEIKRLKERISSIKAQQKETMGKIGQLQLEINNESERREVDCEDRVEGGFMVAYRLDTGEQVHKRRLSPSEQAAQKKELAEGKDGENKEEKPAKETKPRKAATTGGRGKKKSSKKASSKKADGWAKADERAGDEGDDGDK